MSMSYWTVTGFGIDEEDLSPSVDLQIDFIKKYLPSVYEDMQDAVSANDDDIIDMSNTADYLDFCKEWINNYENDYGYTGFACLFAEAIQTNEDGFDPKYHYDADDGKGIIVYEVGLPWEMSERVRQMTEEDMAAVFKKYLTELNLEADIQKQSILLYG